MSSNVSCLVCKPVFGLYTLKRHFLLFLDLKITNMAVFLLFRDYVKRNQECQVSYYTYIISPSFYMSNRKTSKLLKLVAILLKGFAPCNLLLAKTSLAYRLRRQLVNKIAHPLASGGWGGCVGKTNREEDGNVPTLSLPTLMRLREQF